VGSKVISADSPGTAKAIHRRSLFHERGDPLRRGELEQVSDSSAVDAESRSWEGFEGFVAGKQQALERANAWVVLAPFDPGDGWLGNAR